VVEEADKPFSAPDDRPVPAVEEGDTVVTERILRATHTPPPLMPDAAEIPATGKTVEHPGVSVVEVRDGKSGACGNTLIPRT